MLSVGPTSERAITTSNSIDSSSRSNKNNNSNNNNNSEYNKDNNNRLGVFRDNESIHHQVLMSELACMPTTGADADEFQAREEEAEGSVTIKPWLECENKCV